MEPGREQAQKGQKGKRGGNERAKERVGGGIMAHNLRITTMRTDRGERG